MSPLLMAALVAMAVSDALDAFSTVAESRGRSWLAGAFVAGDNTLSGAVAVVGADTLIEHGLKPALVLGVCVCIVTFFATATATKWANVHVVTEPTG